MSGARALALDWGTSTLRAWRLGEAGCVLAQRQQPWGLMHLPAGGFEAALRGITDGWLDDGVPLIAAGMVGSAQGWREVPYVDCPAGAEALASGLLAIDAGAGLTLHVGPGVRHPRPDVMRGEETQCLGALALQPALAERATLLLPGTHSKWLRVAHGRIVDFQTYMTGELYALLREHSILGRPARVAGPQASNEAFDRGVAALRGEPQAGLSPLLFGTRALVLSGRLQAAQSLDYLSGLLIGEELRCALAQHDAAAPLALIGDGALCARYQRALALHGMTRAPTVEGATVAGLWQVALRAGLVGEAA
jgi:2-dehydro-3-deoxygalactonokinase